MNTSTISSLMEKILSYPAYNKDLALFYTDRYEPAWSAEYCNPASHCVMLGEASGDFVGSGKTPEEALENLIKALDSHNWDDP